MPVILSELEKGHGVQLAPRGRSMQPMLYGDRDSVILSPLTDAPSVGDVVFYQRRNGQYILHRIIEQKDGHYVCAGDNDPAPEWPVTRSQIIAVVTAFERKGHSHTTDDCMYRWYCKLLPLLRWYRIHRPAAPLFLFCAYVVLVLHKTLFDRTPTRTAIIRATPFWSYAEWFAGNHGLGREILLNMAAFSPFGFLFTKVFRKLKHPIRTTLLTGFLFTLLIELAQLIFRLGWFELDDMFNNTLGVAIGLGLVHLYDRRKDIKAALRIRK